MTNLSIYNNKIAVLLLCVFIGAATYAEAAVLVKKQSFNKIIQKEFDITRDGMVSLSNRHGKVEVVTHEALKVEVEVKITVEVRSESCADEIFDRIIIAFSNNESTVNVQTSINSKSMWDNFWSSCKNDNFTIDYYVKMPKSNRLDLYNKYGNTYVGELDAPANVDVKYGNVKMDGVNDDLDITIGYGNGTVAKARDVNVALKYGKLNIGELKDLNIESKYSKVVFDKAMDVNSISKYDTYRIGDVNEFKNTGKYDNFEIRYANIVEATSKYTEFEIDELATSAKLDLRYGNATIGGIAPGFASIRLDGDYTDFKLEFQEGADYHFDLAGDYTTIRYPKEADIEFEREEDQEHVVKGVKGNKNSKSLLKARLSYGGLRIK